VKYGAVCLFDTILALNTALPASSLSHRQRMFCEGKSELLRITYSNCFAEGKSELLRITYSNLRLQSVTCPSFPHLTARYTQLDSITLSSPGYFMHKVTHAS
jgi:hypothetical protein